MFYCIVIEPTAEGETIRSPLSHDHDRIVSGTGRY